MVALQVGRTYELTLPPNTPLVPVGSKTPTVVGTITAVSDSTVAVNIDGDIININKNRIWEAKRHE